MLAANDKNRCLRGENALHGQAGWHTEATRNSASGIGRRAASGLWVALLLAIVAVLLMRKAGGAGAAGAH